MSQFTSAETLGILGGIGAVLSPLVALMLPFSFPYLFLLSPIRWFLFLPLFMICLSGAVISIHASSYVQRTPDKAGFRFLLIGFIILICGILSMFNFILILSGISLIIAGGVCDTIWGRVKRARRVTGFPWRGVATSLGGRWHSKLSCRFCGAPLVVLSAIGSRHLVLVKTICPLDKVSELIKLPLAWMDGWTDVFQDRLHRCVKCGERTEHLRTSHQGRNYVRVNAFCGRHRTNAWRRIWAPLYHNVAGRPEVDVGFHSQHVVPGRHPTVRVHRPVRVSPVQTATPQYPRVRQRSVQRGISRQFCSDCGVQVEVGDEYCYRCGSLLH